MHYVLIIVKRIGTSPITIVVKQHNSVYPVQGVPVSEILDPMLIFQIDNLPTTVTSFYDILNHNLNIHTVNYIHVWFY